MILTYQIAIALRHVPHFTAWQRERRPFSILNAYLCNYFMKSFETLQFRVGQATQIPAKYYKILSTNRVDIKEILRLSVSLGHVVVAPLQSTVATSSCRVSTVR